MSVAKRVMLVLAAVLLAASARGQGELGENVVLVLIDGMRWQEAFRGAQEDLLDRKRGGVEEPARARERWWRPTAKERRELLMPFLWQVVAVQGQLLGDRDRGSVVAVANPHRFSYPGYSEMIVGFADPRVDSNRSYANPNRSVLEWLAGRPGFAGRVAVFGAWDRVFDIAGRGRNGIYVNAAFDAVAVGEISPRQELLNRLKVETVPPWRGEPHDAFTFYAAIEYLRANRPRVLWLTFGETDERAHERRYDLYLDAAHRNDAYLRSLWETLQATEGYAGRTTLAVAIDHGRGRRRKDWTDHGAKVRGADEIWLAILGPRTPALGSRIDHDPVTLSQVAATVAAAVGEDYRLAEPRAALPIPGAVAAPRERRSAAPGAQSPVPGPRCYGFAPSLIQRSTTSSCSWGSFLAPNIVRGMPFPSEAVCVSFCHWYEAAGSPAFNSTTPSTSWL